MQCRVLTLQYRNYMFSKTCEYAIRAMIFIAHRMKEVERVGLKDVAKGIDSPEHFTAKILQELSRKGLLMSAKGPNGGFFLDDLCMQVSLADIIRAVDGDKLFVGCGLGLKQCSELHPCPIHSQFKHVRKGLQQMLENSTIGKFSEDLLTSEVYLKP